MNNNYFEEELNYIKDENTREWTKKVLDNVNERFFVEAASTTGKYHPDYALGEGGLYRHTKAAVMIAESLRDNVNAHNVESEVYDIVIAALILHDTCKCGINWEHKYTKHNHPVLAAELIEDVLGDCEDCSKQREFVERVKSLVASHMGQWRTCKWDNCILPIPSTEEGKLVHLCDYLASRKFIEINFDKGI